MESPGSNVLNRSMQGLWSSHRRSGKHYRAEESPTLEPPQTDGVTSSPMPTPQADISNSLDVPISASTTNGKRKVRSSRTAEGSSKRSKLASTSDSTAIAKDYTPPTARLSDLGGVEACIDKMLELVAMPLSHPEVYLHTGVQPPRGVLLHGPPGCGKTLLANAMAGELGVPFISISAPSIVSGMSGESEKTLRDTFEEAKRIAPCLLFIDEIDAITPKRESAQREMERRIVAQFLTCMDDLAWDKNENRPVVVMDAALRRAGRFDHEISMGVPDDVAREKILRVLCSKLRLVGDFDFVALAKATPGYVGADLAALASAAGIIAVKRIFKQLSDGTLVLPDPLPVTEEGKARTIFYGCRWTDNFSAASEALSPPSNVITLRKLAFPTTHSSIAHFLNAHPFPLTPTQLEPLCILHEDFLLALKQLHMAIVQPIKRPHLFKQVGIEAAVTLLAKAVASESGASFISIKGPELLNKYVGESERAVRQVFSRARASSPCVIFLTNLTLWCPAGTIQLDGLDTRKAVYVIGATNRPDIIDPAMVRPGRLDKLLYVDLPGPEERVEIMRTMTRNIPFGDSLGQSVDIIKRQTEALIQENNMDDDTEEDIKESKEKVVVGFQDFVNALDKVAPSVSVAQRRKYESLRSKFAGLPVRVGRGKR
ncbi:P-loop containing nucleoside triphosphate hydrolase protein [Cyathus striatus]|nr:P-loop containing nucleoside triphosphate hydrolase protein [Cyathus striatus]